MENYNEENILDDKITLNRETRSFTQTYFENMKIEYLKRRNSVPLEIKPIEIIDNKNSQNNLEKITETYTTKEHDNNNNNNNNEENSNTNNLINYQSENIERIVVVMAGYNKPKKDLLYEIVSEIKRNVIKLYYREDLIDDKNKAGIILDEKLGKTAIEYPIEALCQISNTHIIVVGDKENLDHIFNSKKFQSIDKVIEQGNSFYENLSKGRDEWKKIYEKISDLKKKKTDINNNEKSTTLSPHIFYLFADTFLSTKENLEDAFKKIEKKDNDISFTFCEKTENDYEKRGLFTYRPWGKLKDVLFRNANLGAIRYSTEDDITLRGINPEKEFYAQIGYNLRKLCNPMNIYRLFKGLGKDRKIITEYFKKEATTKKIEDVISRLLSTEEQKTKFGFVKVDSSLEPDIDSIKDVIRARKMVSLKNFTKVKTIEDCIKLYEECKNKNIKKVITITEDIKRTSIEEIEFQIELLKNKDSYSNIYDTFNSESDKIIALYYDLKKTLETKKEPFWETILK